MTLAAGTPGCPAALVRSPREYFDQALGLNLVAESATMLYGPQFEALPDPLHHLLRPHRSDGDVGKLCLAGLVAWGETWKQARARDGACD